MYCSGSNRQEATDGGEFAELLLPRRGPTHLDVAQPIGMMPMGAQQPLRGCARYPRKPLGTAARTVLRQPPRGGTQPRGQSPVRNASSAWSNRSPGAARHRHRRSRHIGRRRACHNAPRVTAGNRCVARGGSHRVWYLGLGREGEFALLRILLTRPIFCSSENSDAHHIRPRQ